MSVGTLQSLEQAKRRPTANHVDALATTLRLTPAQRNELRRAAGLTVLASDLAETLFRGRGSPDTIWDELSECTWVGLVTNERKEIVAWNRLANSVAELDIGQLPSQMHRSVLKMATTKHFRARLQNWDELIGRLISFLKDEGADIGNAEPPAYIQAVLASIAADDGEILPKLYDLWLRAPVWRAEMRNVHPVEWRLSDGTELSFHGLFGEWSEYDGLFSFDWHAANASTLEYVGRARSDAETSPSAWPVAPISDELRLARADVGMSRTALSRASDVPVASIAAYEAGTRRPRREPLLRLCGALTLDGYRMNRLLRSLGYAEEPSDFARWLCGEEPATVYRGKGKLHGAPGMASIRSEAEAHDWPIVVLDAGCHAIYANSDAERLFHLNRRPAIPGRPAPHLLQLMTSSSFRNQVRNWNEVVSRVAPGRIERHLTTATIDPAVRNIKPVLDYVRETDPSALQQLREAWRKSPGADGLRRVAFHFEWTTENDEELSFNCVFSNWNAYDPLKAMDLFPANATTFAWLARH